MLRIEVVRNGKERSLVRPELEPVLVRITGFSVSGGGVGGNMLRFIAGGADCSRPPRLDKFLCTRFVAA